MGVVFALTVWNPNFTKARSWYMRKFTTLMWGNIGFNWGYKYYND